jgi:5-methylcytosine-specific restriction endonuclease McrA
MPESGRFQAPGIVDFPLYYGKLFSMTLCYYCKQPMTKGGTKKPRSATSDHLIPKSRGGDSSPANKVRCCFKCNNEKGDMTESEYAAFRANRKPGSVT